MSDATDLADKLQDVLADRHWLIERLNEVQKEYAALHEQVMLYQSDPLYGEQRNVGADLAARYLLRELREDLRGGTLAPGPLADAVAEIRRLRDRVAELERGGAWCSANKR